MLNDSQAEYSRRFRAWIFTKISFGGWIFYILWWWGGWVDQASERQRLQGWPRLIGRLNILPGCRDYYLGQRLPGQTTYGDKGYYGTHHRSPSLSLVVMDGVCDRGEGSANITSATHRLGNHHAHTLMILCHNSSNGRTALCSDTYWEPSLYAVKWPALCIHPAGVVLVN